MKNFRFAILSVFAVVGSFLIGCTSIEEPDYREKDYGYVQFKLYKEASYTAPGSKAAATVKDQLEYLSEASKLRVSLLYGNEVLNQVLILSSSSAETAEYGLRSEKLQLLAGEYEITGFRLLNGVDEELYIGQPEEGARLVVTAGGMTSHDLTVNVVPRGQLRFRLVTDLSGLKDREDLENEVKTRSQQDNVTFMFNEVDSIAVQVISDKYVTYNFGYSSNEKKLPVEFSIHFDEEDDVEDGYRVSSAECDSLVSVPAGRYRINGYELYSSKRKQPLAINTSVADDGTWFAVSDNEVTDADVKVTISDKNGFHDYINDYYALYKIWLSLDGPNWSYEGENYSRGTNWDFNKDVDLWGEQPGVQLHNNGRVAMIDISDFGFKGELSPAIGDLTELVEIYLGTHNDKKQIGYIPNDPTVAGQLQSNKSRMARHKEYLGMIHPASQLSEAAAFAYKHQGRSIPAVSMYDMGLTEKDIFDSVTGLQKDGILDKVSGSIRPFDTSHGTLCNGLTKLPDEIGNLTKLEYLYIANSTIAELPGEEVFSKLVSLTDFELYNCPNMKTFPVQIGRMPELISMNLANNKQWDPEQCNAGMKALAEGPSAEKIQILYFRQNRLTEFKHEVFSKFKKIGLLDLAYNEIEGVVESPGSDIAFVQLYLDHNKITGFGTSENSDGHLVFCNFDDVETLSASYNQIKYFPNIFHSESRFTLGSISLSNNLIGSEGTFCDPAQGTFQGIKVGTLDLSGNSISKFPLEFAESNSTVSVYNMRSNGMTEVPEEAFDVHKENHAFTETFDFSYNKIDDLPKTFSAENFPYLYSVDLSYNSFDTFPREPLNSASLIAFGIRGQRNDQGKACLKEWPTGIFKHTGLRALYIGNNDLRKIDDTISTLIYNLDIAGNPKIEFDATDVCYAWKAGMYLLIYDKTQNIKGCPEMLE